MEIITWPISIKSIFGNNRFFFEKANQGNIRESSIKNVEKVLNCGSGLQWFASYKCDWCWDTQHIPFTCKSRFCNSCSQPQSDLRTNKLLSRLPDKLLYKHITFTIPWELRIFFKNNRKALSIIPYTAANSIMFFLRKQKLTPWIIAVIHSFWAKLNRNPHTHLIVTNWAIHDSWQFKNNIFIPFTAVRTSRTKFLVKNLKNRCYKNLSWEKLIREIKFLNTFYDYHSKITGEKTTWHVHFPDDALHLSKTLWYIGRYVKRPVIAQSRILDYDWENVTFNYLDKKDKLVKEITCPVFEFIGLLIQHIPNRYFHMVYHYGIFANRCKKKYLNIITNYFWHSSYRFFVPKSFAERIFAFTGKNPLQCNCWGIFHKYKIFIPWYAPIYFDSW